jgi:hypothetical protein
VEEALVELTIGVKITIDRRIKEIDKMIRKAKRDWNKYENLRRKILDEAPRYGNEFDYSTEMGHEDQKKYDEAEEMGMKQIKKQTNLKDEKDYLKGILKGKMTKFDKYDWDYMK